MIPDTSKSLSTNTNSKLFTKENLQSYYEYVQVPDGLEEFVISEYNSKKIMPQFNDIFKALRLTPLDKVKVVILGQDPYPTENVAMGLAFSVNKGVNAPMSIRNMFKEINSDFGTNVKIDKNLNADLTDWAEQGVLLLNTVLTVEVGHSKSHAKHGWEIFTDSIIKAICNRNVPTVFLLFGNDAQKKEKIICGSNNHIIKAIHPSPLSAKRGFFGSRVFKQINNILIQNNIEPIDWVSNRK